MPETAAIDPIKRAASERSFVRIMTAVAMLLALSPTLLNVAGAPSGHHYLGLQYNIDDHMVYAAWMRQAMDGAFQFDNRFTTDSQPVLTIHLYFLVLGWVAKIIGIPAAMTLGRVIFSGLLVSLLYRLARRMFDDVYTTKLALALAVFGGGIGFTVWHTFGQAIERPTASLVKSFLLGRLPTDVWQPEGFVFSSMLTSGLFAASLCLIVVVFLAVLDAQEGWRWTVVGSLAMLVLVNIHTYDSLIIGISLLGLLGSALVRRQATVAWLVRTVVILLGAVPSVLWLLHVLARDSVFRERAATLTFSPNFRQVIFGYLGLFCLGIIWLIASSFKRKIVWRSWLGGGVLVAITLIGLLASRQHASGYFMAVDAWLVVTAAAVAAICLLSTGNTTQQLVSSWAILGTVALYFPALFQRKLAMGLAIPWAFLAAAAISLGTRSLERSTRNFALVLVIIAGSASSIQWLVRERQLAILNVSNTTVHSVYLSQDSRLIIEWLEKNRSVRTVVLAMPGQSYVAVDSDGKPLADAFVSPYISDLNPFVSGLAGVYTYAGHWSETPHYQVRRDEAMRVFLASTNEEVRHALLSRIRPDYIVSPVPATYPAIPLVDLRPFGEVVYQGPQFMLIRVSDLR